MGLTRFIERQFKKYLFIQSKQFVILWVCHTPVVLLFLYWITYIR